MVNFGVSNSSSRDSSFVFNAVTSAYDSCFLGDILDRDIDPIDKSCSDIAKSPICPGPSASVITLPFSSSPSFWSNLVNQENCQLGAFEAWGLQKIL